MFKFKYITNNKFITFQQFLSSDVIAGEFEKKATKLLYTVWSLVMVRNQLPAQAVKYCQIWLIKYCLIIGNVH